MEVLTSNSVLQMEEGCFDAPAKPVELLEFSGRKRRRIQRCDKVFIGAIVKAYPHDPKGERNFAGIPGLQVIELRSGADDAIAVRLIGVEIGGSATGAHETADDGRVEGFAEALECCLSKEGLRLVFRQTDEKIQSCISGMEVEVVGTKATICQQKPFRIVVTGSNKPAHSIVLVLEAGWLDDGIHVFAGQQIIDCRQMDSEIPALFPGSTADIGILIPTVGMKAELGSIHGKKLAPVEELRVETIIEGMEKVRECSVQA